MYVADRGRLSIGRCRQEVQGQVLNFGFGVVRDSYDSCVLSFTLLDNKGLFTFG